MTSWREEKLPVETRRADDRRRAARGAAGDGVQLLDVRERSEWDEGHMPGSIHTPYHDLARDPGRASTTAARSRSICNSGPRAAVAASLLKRLGVDDVIHVVDGGVAQLMTSAQRSTK